MALIKCPECGKEISNKSKQCIHCGYPLDEPIINQNTKYVLVVTKERIRHERRNQRRD